MSYTERTAAALRMYGPLLPAGVRQLLSDLAAHADATGARLDALEQAAPQPQPPGKAKS